MPRRGGKFHVTQLGGDPDSRYRRNGVIHVDATGAALLATLLYDAVQVARALL